MLFRFPLFASLAFRVLSLCAVVKVRTAILEDDIVFETSKTVSIFIVPVSLRLASLSLASYPAPQQFLVSESTSGYEFRQELISP